MKEQLCRASMDKKVFGVCGGFAHYFDMDSTIVRIIAILLFFVAGLSLWVYFISALVMPISNQY